MKKGAGGAGMKVLVGGSSGLVGSTLVPALARAGHRVTRLVRGASPSSAEELTVSWDPAADRLDSRALEGFDAVVHLGGENIGEGRWNPEKKRRMRESRIQSTSLLSRTLAGLARPPKMWVCASAVGIYGDRGEERLTESSPPGTDFLARLTVDWEAAVGPAAAKGIRVVHVRSGMVLDARRGGLAKMLLPFKLGVGGVIGSGRQYWTWIALEDEVGVILHALATDRLSGPVNAVAPQQVTNAEFTKTLGRVVNRPTVFPMPAFAARLALGEVADALLLASQRVEPRRLIESGYRFRHPELEGALRHTLGAA